MDLPEKEKKQEAEIFSFTEAQEKKELEELRAMAKEQEANILAANTFNESQKTATLAMATEYTSKGSPTVVIVWDNDKGFMMRTTATTPVCSLMIAMGERMLLESMTRVGKPH
jgi:hypothetical protein